MTAHGLVGVADAGAFLARLTRLDPRALVRLGLRRPDGAVGPASVGRARHPEVAGAGPDDATVSAAELLAGWPGRVRSARATGPVLAMAAAAVAGAAVESVSVAELGRLATAAAGRCARVGRRCRRPGGRSAGGPGRPS